MKGQQAYEHAYAHADTTPDGGRAYGSMLELVAAAIDFDPETERIGKARRIIASRMKPGGTRAEGTVVLPGLETYGYEPHRLIADDEGSVIENRHATVRHKQAEADRAEKALDRAQTRADRERWEADIFQPWAESELAAGRNPAEITWDNCLRETGHYKDEASEDEAA